MNRNAKKRDKEIEERISKDYLRLVKKCDLHLDLMEAELPPPIEPLNEQLENSGISRRSFMKWTAVTTAALMLPPIFKSRVARAAEQFGRGTSCLAPFCRVYRLQ